jgi:hypothetical protein
MINNNEIDEIFEFCIKVLTKNPEQPIDKAINTVVTLLGVETASEKDIALIKSKIDKYLEVEQFPAHFLDDKTSKPWLSSVTSDHYYSDRYEEYLRIDQKLPSQVVTRIRATNREILDRLGNPYSNEEFKKQGLVVGNVQSGKTANYISLINLAADYGYKLIILITGIHNNLRSQTQKRVNEGFIGFDIEKSEFVGVGVTASDDKEQIIKAREPHCFTNTTHDFDTKNRSSTAIRLENAKNPIIMVVKKNHSTLNNIIQWIRNNEEGQRFIDFPALIIDDEADNASINTSKNPNETTKINGQIREIFNLFRKGSYIGYTATPFANIFIDPDSYDDALADDLFPKHFIFNLEAPSNYLGADKFFLTDDGEPNYDSPYVEFIEDNEPSIPLKKPKDFVIEDIPPSLIEATYAYLVSIVIKGLRYGTNKHSSMLVNISHKTAHQKDVHTLMSQELDEIRRAVKFKAGLSQNERMQNTHLSGIYRHYCDFKEECDVEVFFAKLYAAVESVKVRLINSESKDKLNYDDHENGLNVIAIGGYSLSRGFTLEGLTISYLIRNTAMSDTLLQMGRWFGYRDHYDDLCKLYINEESFEWYAFIAQAVNELREEFILMEQNNLTPSQYGLKVRNSDSGLLITAKNKMFHTEDMLVSKTYSEDSFSLRSLKLNDLPKQRAVFESVAQDIESSVGLVEAFDHSKGKDSDIYQFASGVNVDLVIKLLESYDYALGDREQVDQVVRYIQDRPEELSEWDIIIHKKYLGIEGKSQLRTFSSSSFHEGYLQILDGGGRILRPWEEAFGLTVADYQQIKIKLDGKQSAKLYRRNRVRPLIALKSLDIRKKIINGSGEKQVEDIATHVPAFAISFPKSANDKRVAYVCNSVFLKATYGEEELEDETE